MAAKIRPMQITPDDADVVRDFGVDFSKLAPSRDFETRPRAVKKTQGGKNEDLNVQFIISFFTARSVSDTHKQPCVTNPNGVTM